MEITLAFENEDNLLKSESIKKIIEAKIIEALKNIDCTDIIEKELTNVIGEYFINDGYSVMDEMFSSSVKDHVLESFKKKLGL